MKGRNLIDKIKPGVVVNNLKIQQNDEVIIIERAKVVGVEFIAEFTQAYFAYSLTDSSINIYVKIEDVKGFELDTSWKAVIEQSLKIFEDKHSKIGIEKFWKVVTDNEFDETSVIKAGEEYQEVLKDGWKAALKALNNNDKNNPKDGTHYDRSSTQERKENSLESPLQTNKEQ